jgi:multiple sugar transport system permease protein
MQSQKTAPRDRSNLAALGAFVLVFVVLFVVALMNAPIRSVAEVTESLGNYLTEVRDTAIPFMIIISVIAAALGVVIAIVVRREWPNPRRRRALIAGYAFLAPYLLVTLIFTVGVILFALYISFTEYQIYTTPVWVGLSNYVKALTSKPFHQSLYNVLWYALIVTIAQTVLAMAMAVLLNTSMRFKRIIRTVFYAPSVTSSVVITLIFVWLYLKTGYINLLFTKVWGLFGLEWTAVDWLGNPKGLFQLVVEAFGGKIGSAQWYLRGPSVAWMCLMVQNIFTTVPTFMIMFLAALQDINPALYEAAEIDGANGWQRFWKISLPLLRPIVVMVLVLSTIGTLQIFDQVYLATAGGPLGTTMTPVYLVYSEALGRLGPIQMGYASAIAFILAVIIFIFTFIQRRVIERGAEIY